MKAEEANGLSVTPCEKTANMVSPQRHEKVTKLYEDFDLVQVFKDNHKTANLYSITFAPDPKTEVFAVSASNQFSISTTTHLRQYLLLFANYFNGKLPKKNESLDPSKVRKQDELMSFAWLPDRTLENTEFSTMNFKALVGTRGGSVKRFNVQKDPKELKPFQETHAAPVTSIVGIKNGQYGVSLSRKNGEVRVWDFEDAESSVHKQFLQDAVCLTVTTDEQSVILGCKNSLHSITLKKVAGGRTTVGIDTLVPNLRATANGDLQICKTLSANEVVVVSGWHHVLVLNIKTNSNVASWRCNAKTKTFESFDVNKPLGVCILGCIEGTVEIRDVYSGQLYRRISSARIPKHVSLTHVGVDENRGTIIAGSGAMLYMFRKPHILTWSKNFLVPFS